MQTPEEWEESDKKRSEANNKEHKTEVYLKRYDQIKGQTLTVSSTLQSFENSAKSQERKTDLRLMSNRDESTQISGMYSQSTLFTELTIICIEKSVIPLNRDKC